MFGVDTKLLYLNLIVCSLKCKIRLVLNALSPCFKFNYDRTTIHFVNENIIDHRLTNGIKGYFMVGNLNIAVDD